MGRRALPADCDGKSRFTSRRVAEKVAGRVARRIGESMSVYPCRVCHGLHIGVDSMGMRYRA
jgi:hypothetical protein